MANVTWYPADQLKDAAQSRLKPASVVVDVGMGIRPQQLLRADLSICIEPYLPYLEFVREHNPDSPRALFLHGTWSEAMKLLLDRSVDTVIAGDVIEHLVKGEGWDFLREAQRIAKQQVIIFTPLGFYPQCYDGVPRKDRWGMDGGHWQTHRSGWEPKDFSDEWDILACESYHLVDEHEQLLTEPFGAFYAIWTRCEG